MRKNVKILAVGSDGDPQGWISVEKAILLKFLNKTIDIGQEVFTLHGGLNASTGEKTIISTSSIVILTGKSKKKKKYRHATLENSLLFARDNHTCAYCNETFSDRDLTRDHINPRCNGGKDTWDNVVAACKKCNHRKDRTLPGTSKFPKLHFLPYVPCKNEWWILKRGSNILKDQYEYLSSQISNRNSRIFGREFEFISDN